MSPRRGRGALFVVAGLVALALSGCLAGSGETMSARAGLGDALDAARDWTEAPALTSIYAIEPFEHLIEDGFEAKIHLDDHPGDGRAPGWLYVFQGPDAEVFVVVAAGLGVIAEGKEIQDGRGAVLDAWSLDSTDVATILSAEPEWPEAAKDTLMFWGLEQEDEGPVWSVEVQDGDGSWYARVHAESGDVLSLDEGRPVQEFHEAYAWNSGIVTPVAGLEIGVDVGGNGSIMAVANIGVGTGIVTVTLEGPDGLIDQRTFMVASGWLAEYEATAGPYRLYAEADPVGAYEVSLELRASW